ncbi:MAG: hypothetical protein B6245_10610 [Desulfobacteraceae bacterium 4572_88]|nr:MAG: hypothetical protein B6245_10610 [Desulfobacteraceae bacterium 4572_88]
MNNIFLIGYRCTGKTSVGKALARQIEWPFMDSDSEITRACQMTISRMVSKHGWDFFREKERETLGQLCGLYSYVIATGGGVILNPQNVSDMQENGAIIWLKARPETVLERMLQDKITKDQRPALTSEGFFKETEKTLAVREPLYEAAKDFSINTDDLDTDDICRAIIRTLWRTL